MCSRRSSVERGTVRSSSLEESKSEEKELEAFRVFEALPWEIRPGLLECEFLRGAEGRPAFVRAGRLVLVAVVVFRMFLILSIVHLARREIQGFSWVFYHFFRYILTSVRFLSSTFPFLCFGLTLASIPRYSDCLDRNLRKV